MTYRLLTWAARLWARLNPPGHRCKLCGDVYWSLRPEHRFRNLCPMCSAGIAHYTTQQEDRP